MKKRVFVVFLILSLFALFQAQSFQCHQIFNYKPTTIDAPYFQVYAGQNFVGTEYALYKALRDIGVKPTKKLNDLNKSERAALEAEILKELKAGTPAVRDPQGRIFLLDGHHSLYLATVLFSDIQQMPITLSLVYDGTKTGVSWEKFVQTALEQKWFYEPTAKQVLEKPLHAHELSDSVERSMLGLFFVSVEDSFKVPMKGKHFSPFIQFYLADLIKQEQIYQFPTHVNFDEVPQLQKTLLSNKKVVAFLISHLNPKASKKLKKFLESL